MVQKGTVPKFIYIYLPNGHTGKTNATNFGVDEKTGKPIQPTAPEQVEDGDVALGMVVQHPLQSPIYYDANLTAELPFSLPMTMRSQPSITFICTVHR